MDVPIDTSKMSEQELQFHYFKMHDSDNNNKLDGCELIKSLIHWHGKFVIEKKNLFHFCSCACWFPTYTPKARLCCSFCFRFSFVSVPLTVSHLYLLGWIHCNHFNYILLLLLLSLSSTHYGKRRVCARGGL